MSRTSKPSPVTPREVEYLDEMAGTESIDNWRDHALEYRGLVRRLLEERDALDFKLANVTREKEYFEQSLYRQQQMTRHLRDKLHNSKV